MAQSTRCGTEYQAGGSKPGDDGVLEALLRCLGVRVGVEDEGCGARETVRV